MSWLGNRRHEGHEAETGDVKPRNQILQTPEKEIPEAKGKLDRFQDKSPEEQKKSLDEQSQYAKERPKLERPNNASTEGFPTKRQIQLEKGKETQMER